MPHLRDSGAGKASRAWPCPSPPLYLPRDAAGSGAISGLAGCAISPSLGTAPTRRFAVS